MKTGIGSAAFRHHMLDWLGWGGHSSSSYDESECFEGVENGGDLIDALFGLAPETGGEDFCILADGGQELADCCHLGGEVGGPIGERLWIVDGGLRMVGVIQADFDLLGGGSAGCLEIRAQPADQAALFFRCPCVVEGDEAGEKFLFEGFCRGTSNGEHAGG